MFPGKWSPGNPFNLTDDQKEDIVRAVAGNCINLVRGTIPVACAVVCAPLSILLVGYWPCVAACTAAGEIAIDPLLEDYAPAIVDKAFKDQTEGEPTTPGSKTSEWVYFRYPGERLFTVTVAELDPEAPLVLAGTMTVNVSVPKELAEKAPEHNDCRSHHDLHTTPFPVSAVELAIGEVNLPLLSVSNLPDGTIYSFEWNTTAFADGTYTLRPRALGTNGFAYQYPFGTEMVVANHSVILRLAAAQTLVGEGEPYLLSGTFSDPGPEEAFVQIRWGDGQTDLLQVGPPASGTDWSFSAQHVYLDDEPTDTRRDNYAVQVEVITDRVVANGSTVVTVSNTPPIIESLAVAPVLVSTGAVLQASAEFGDFGRDVHTATWLWGDGTSSTIPNAISPLLTTHAYSSAGVYAITYVIDDDDRGSAAANFAYVVAHNPSAFGGAGAGQIYARLCDTNQPPNCVTENARFGFVLDQGTGFFRARFTLPGLDASASRYQTSGTNAAGQLEVTGPCAINGIDNLLVVLTNTFENVVTTYVTNSSGIITNSVTNIITRVETNTATFTFRIRAAQSPTNTFQIRLSAQVGTNVVARTLETDANQPVRSGAVIVNPLRAAPASSTSAQALSPLRIGKRPPAKPTKTAPPKTKKRPLTNRR